MEPLQPPGTGLAVLRGNLCPDGAVIKQSAASPHLLKHRGRALVFDRLEDYNLAREAEDLPVDEATVLVLRNAGPKGYPGMPEAGNLPLPRKLLQRGVTDIVRVSDARMSGTGYGTVVLHVAPEAALGGPLALVQTGDWVQLDVPARTLRMEVDDQELGRRRQQWQPPDPRRPAATPASTSTMCSRPTRAPILTSWSAPAATSRHATTTDRPHSPAPPSIPGEPSADTGSSSRQGVGLAWRSSVHPVRRMRPRV
jgi:dihydroxyacid dehydratase/phosphogluconate dehydratase